MHMASPFSRSLSQGSLEQPQLCLQGVPLGGQGRSWGFLPLGLLSKTYMFLI